MRAVDRAEVGDLGDAAELAGWMSWTRREDGRHRVVDPDVDRPELGLGALGGRLDLLGSATSVGTTSAVPPSRLDLGGGVQRRPRCGRAGAMRGPRLANSRAVARPTPADAPVRTTTMRVRVPVVRGSERERVAAGGLQPADLAQPESAPSRRARTRRRGAGADREDGGPRHRSRSPRAPAPGRRRTRTSCGGVDLLVADGEVRAARRSTTYSSSCPFASSSSSSPAVVVRPDGRAAGLPPPRRDAEGADAEVAAERLPVRLGVRIEGRSPGRRRGGP